MRGCTYMMWFKILGIIVFWAQSDMQKELLELLSEQILNRKQKT